MCLAIPGQIVEIADDRHVAKVDVSGVRRQVNVALLDDELAPGDWVLIHVGFAMSRISAEQADEQMRLLRMLGEDAEAMAELEGYSFGREAEGRVAEGEDAEGEDAEGRAAGARKADA